MLENILLVPIINVIIEGPSNEEEYSNEERVKV